MVNQNDDKVFDNGIGLRSTKWATKFWLVTKRNCCMMGFKTQKSCLWSMNGV